MIKVHFQYPWIVPDSSYYKNILNNPPKWVKYINVDLKKYDGIVSSKKFKYMKSLKSTIRKTINLVKIPNYQISKIKDADLIHCAHCLSLNKIPWVVDTEHYWNFAAASEIAYSYLGKKLIEKQLSKENCKAILPWSNAAKNSISDVIKNKNILNKINILPFATDLKNKTKKKHEGINLLFVGRYFYQKGGQDTLKVFDNLTKKYDDVNATFVSDVPKEYLDKYSKNKKINFLNLMPQKELFKKVYPNSDIFVYPGYSDSYGFSFIEAKAFKLPIITVDGFARDDVVEDNKDGYIIRNPKITWKNNLPIINNKQVILDMQSKIKELIENNNLRKKFGNNGYKKVESGIFSIDYRNKKLKEIYDVCL